MTGDEFVSRTLHVHYVCPECGNEICQDETPTAGSHLAAAETHAGEAHPDMWGPEPEMQVLEECPDEG